MKTIKLLTAISAAAVLFLFSLTGCTLLSEFQAVEEGEITEYSDYTAVEVYTVAGSIEVSEWEEDYTFVQYTKVAESEAALDNIYPFVGVDNGKLVVRREQHSTLIGSGSISFTVFIPEGDYTSELQSTSGGIVVRNMEAEDMVSAETTSGSISVAGADSCVLHSVSGAVDFICEDTDYVSVSTTSGAIDGEVRSIAANTSVKIESISGSVDLICPSGTGGTCTLSSLSGSIKSDLDPVMSGDSKSGSAMMEIRVKTLSGAIRIQDG